MIRRGMTRLTLKTKIIWWYDQIKS